MQLTLSIAIMQLTCFAIMWLCVSKPGQVLSAVWTRNLPILVTTPWPNKPLTPNLKIIFIRTDNSFMIKWYKELPSRSWHVLFFTLHYFFSYTYTLLFCWKTESRCCGYPQLDYRPPLNNIYYKIILVWELISILLTNATHCLYSMVVIIGYVSGVIVSLRVKQSMW